MSALLGAEMNVELLQKVKEKILEEPLQFAMEEYFTPEVYGMDAPREKIPNCGTAACIAGWVLTLHTGKNPRELWLADIPISSRAARLLGLTWEEGDRLFILSGWPFSFGKRYRNAKTPQEQAQIAAERIEHFIETERE